MYSKYLGYTCRVGPKILGNICWINKYSKHPEKAPIDVRYGKVHKFILKSCNSLKCKFLVEGTENIPEDGNVLITPNHQSNMDPLTLLAVFPKPVTFVAKKESEQFPIVGKVIKCIDGKFMDRSSLRNEVRIMMSISKSLEENPSQSVIIFPEGTRSKDFENREVGSFKAGALKPAYNTKKPILPVAIFGTFRVLDMEQPNMKKFPIQVKILKPIYYEEYSKYSTVEFASILEKKIREEVDILREKDKKLFFKFSYRSQKKKIIREYNKTKEEK